MSSNQLVRFTTADFRKGHRGVTSAHDTDRCSIDDLRVWMNGQLGPRPTWAAEQNLSANMVQNSRIFQASLWYGYTTEIKGFVAISNTRAEFYTIGDLGSPSGRVIATSENIDLYSTVTQITDRLWLIGGSLLRLEGAAVAVVALTLTNVVTALETRFSGGAVFTCDGSTVHQGRAFYWGSMNTVGAGLAHRVYYSNSVITGGNAAYGTFTSASQYFDVDGTVAGCVSVGPNLLIWTVDGRWTMMQGSGDPGAATFSNMGYGRIPPNGMVPVVIDQQGVFPSSDNLALVTIGGGGTLDDATWEYLANGTAPSGAFTNQGSGSSLTNAILLGELRYYRSGVWYSESWDDLHDGGDFSYGAQYDVGGSNNQEFLWFYDFSASKWKYYYRPSTVNSPAYSDDRAGDFEEETEGRLYLPRLFTPNKQLRVKRVIVDCKVWKIAAGSYSYPTPSMDVSVWDGTTSHDMTIGPGPDPLGDVTATVSRRLVFTAPPHPHNRYAEVGLSNIKSVSIEAITVEFEVSEGPIQ